MILPFDCSIIILINVTNFAGIAVCCGISFYEVKGLLEVYN